MLDRIASPLARRIRSLQDRYDSALPPGLFAGYLFFTVFMIIATAAFQLLQFPVATPVGIRIKGFFWEFNWGINHLFFIPIGLTCCALVIREVRRLAGRLCDAGMLVDEDFRALERESVERDWKAYRPGPKLFGAIFGLSFFEAYWEWYIGSLGPIYGFIEAPEPEFRG